MSMACVCVRQFVLREVRSTTPLQICAPRSTNSHNRLNFFPDWHSHTSAAALLNLPTRPFLMRPRHPVRSEEHTSELQSHVNLVCRLLLEKKKKIKHRIDEFIFT